MSKVIKNVTEPTGNPIQFQFTWFKNGQIAWQGTEAGDLAMVLHGLAKAIEVGEISLDIIAEMDGDEPIQADGPSW